MTLISVKHYIPWSVKENRPAECDMIEHPAGAYVRYEDFNKLFDAARNLMQAPRKGPENADAVFALWNVLEDMGAELEKGTEN